MTRPYFSVILLFTLISFPTFSQNSDAQLQYQLTDIKIVDGKLIKSQSFEIQINKRDGDEYAEISIPFSKDNKITKIEAFVKDNTGKIIRKLKKSEITDRSAIPDGSFYTDYFVREFDLKHNSYPYTIYYSYQEEYTQFMYLDDWLPLEDIKIPTLKAELKVDVPKDYEIKYLQQFIDSPKVETNEKSITYCWQTSYSQIVKPELYSSMDDFPIPRVVVVPLQFVYDKPGSFESWNTFGSWSQLLLSGLDDLPANEINRIKDLVKNSDNKKEQIKILYHYLQDETRYLNVSVETGGLKPYPASYVAKNKFGDCKALSNYFKSVLGVIGIPSFYTKVNAGEKIDKISTEFPSQQFNHIILFVPLENDSIWLDCTSDGPFGYLGTFTQNRYALVSEQDKSYLKKTPSLGVDEVLESRSIKINQKADGSVISSFSNTYRGDMFEKIYPFAESMNEADKSKIVREYFVNGNFEVLDYHFVKRERDQAEIKLEINAKADKAFQKQGNEILVKIMPFDLPKFEKPKDRKLPVHLDFPINKVDTVQYTISNKFTFGELPKDTEISGKYGYYKFRITRNNNTIEVVKQFILNSGNYNITEYADFYKFIFNATQIENSNFIVLKSTN